MILHRLFILLVTSYAVADDWTIPETYPVSMTVFHVKKTKHIEKKLFSGTMTSQISPTIYAQMPGEIERIQVHSGDQVKQGQIIAYIDQQAVEGTYLSAKEQLKLAKHAYQTASELFEELAMSQSQYEQTKAKYQQADAKLVMAQSALQKSQVVAPCDGTIGILDIKNGRYIGPGQPITNITCKHQQLVDFFVPDHLISDVKNSSFGIQTTAKDHAIPATLLAVDQAIQADRRIALFRLKIDHIPDFMPGKSVTVHASSKPITWITIPIPSIQVKQNQYFVYRVQKNKTLKATSIQIGQIYQDQVEVIKGLKAGDQIIKAGWCFWKPDIGVHLITEKT
jgi:membrane fusion protein (multidrug efflux system)